MTKPPINNPKPIDDCFLHDKDRLTHQEALEILKTNITPISTAQTCATSKALNQVLAQTLTAPRPIPAHRNAAVDGYAFHHNNYDAQKGTRFKVTQRVTAGDPLLDTIAPDTAARIFTGAVMPTSLDTVVMQEDVTTQTDETGTIWVTIPGGMKPQANCRQAGEDTKQDDPLVKAGTKLKPQHIAAIASAGITQIPVYSPLKIASLSTGNEIIRDEKHFQLGKVFDSNGPMLQALAKTQNCQVQDLGIIKDDQPAIEATLLEAAKTHDVIITSGGASKGEEDHMISTLEKIGTRHMWQLAIKPGRPLCFGTIKSFGTIKNLEKPNDTLFIGLPGNPVAAFVCFILYVIPMLARLGGQTWPEPTRFKIPANFSINKKKPDRREFMRGTLVTQDGQACVKKFPKDGSGLIQSLTQADGLIEIEEDLTNLEQGQLVNFLPFSQWGL